MRRRVKGEVEKWMINAGTAETILYKAPEHSRKTMEIRLFFVFIVVYGEEVPPTLFCAWLSSLPICLVFYRDPVLVK